MSAFFSWEIGARARLAAAWLGFLAWTAYFFHDFSFPVELYLQEYPSGIWLTSGYRSFNLGYSMPLAPCLGDWVQRAAFSPELIWVLFLASGCGLIIAAGSALASAEAGLLGAAFWVFLLRKKAELVLIAPNYFETLVYALSVSTAALALVLRPRVRTWVGELLAALAIGITLLAKSPLFLLPLLLAAWELWSGKLRRGETTRSKIAVLALVPYMFLLPWVYMNCATGSGFAFFEHGRSDQNLISGVLGVVYTMEGSLSFVTPAERQNLALWALKTVASNPLAYFASVLKRLYSVFLWHPVLFALALAGLLRARMSVPARAAAFLCVYFVLLHCLLSVEQRYFFPLWPLLCACAALVFFRPSGEDGTQGPPTITLWAAAGFFVASAAAVAALLLAYPHRARTSVFSEVRLDLPARVLCAASSEALSAVNLPAAERYARAALLRAPTLDTYSAYLHVLLAKGVDIARLLDKKSSDCSENRYFCSLLLFANASRRGDAEGRAFYAGRMLTTWREYNIFFNAFSSDDELRLYIANRSADSGRMLAAASHQFDTFPGGLASRFREDLRRELPRLPLQEPDPHLHAVLEYLERAPDPEFAVSYILEQLALKDNPVLRAKLARFFLKTRRTERGLAQLSLLKRQREVTVDDLFDLLNSTYPMADLLRKLKAAYLAGDYRAAVSFGEQYLLSSPPSPEFASLFSGALARSGECVRARAIVGQALEWPISDANRAWLQASVSGLCS